MYVALLGRQPALGNAELERLFGGGQVTPLSSSASLVDTPLLDIERLGGTLKAGKVVLDIPTGDWHKVSQKIVQHYSGAWTGHEGKITLGVSSYGFSVSAREVQKLGIILKQKLKASGVSLRLIPNTDPALSSATSHHNKLGLSANKVELLIVRGKNGRAVVAESTGAQNITAYTRRDQARPKRDAFVGMLPPKLAQIMINLAIGSWHIQDDKSQDESSQRPIAKSHIPIILDPFCGTGVILQEAALMGYNVYGTDLVDKMISYSSDNLAWLEDSHHIKVNAQLHAGDAMTAQWQQPIGAVVAETYLGQPFSAPPSPPKLAEVRKTCNHIITEFLKNLSGQIDSGTPVCIAVPAWKAVDGSFTHLPLIETIAQLGFKPHEFHHVAARDLMYYREDQVVARELLILTKI